MGYFEQAVQLDARYARAWVGLADSRSALAGDGEDREMNFRKAREAASRALALNPDLGEAHAAMAWIRTHADWGWDGADASYKRALALDPGNAVVISHAGILARILGHLEEASALGLRAMQMDPLSPGTRYNAGISLYYAGKYPEAIAAFQNALELLPEMSRPHSFIRRVCLAQSRFKDALAEAESEKDPSYRAFGLALAHFALGHNPEAAASLNSLITNFQIRTI